MSECHLCRCECIATELRRLTIFSSTRVEERRVWVHRVLSCLLEL